MAIAMIVWSALEGLDLATTLNVNQGYIHLFAADGRGRSPVPGSWDH